MTKELQLRLLQLQQQDQKRNDYVERAAAGEIFEVGYRKPKTDHR